MKHPMPIRWKLLNSKAYTNYAIKMHEILSDFGKTS